MEVDPNPPKGFFFTKENTRAVSTARVFFRILSREIRQAAQISFSNDLFHLGRTLHAFSDAGTQRGKDS